MRSTASRFLILAVVLGVLPALAAGSAEYHWVGNGGPPQWNASGNWSPARITPLTTDRLVFDNGVVTTVTGLTTATIGQLVVSNGTQLTLNANSGSTLIQISGDTGDDLVIAPGASLAVTTANVLLLELVTGTTGTIGGIFSAAGAQHRLHAADANALVFTAGGVASALTGFGGNLFGAGGGNSGLNSVRFQGGSTYIQGAGGNPFGAAQPSSVVIFDPGSLFRLNASIAPSISGRTYGNFEYNGPGQALATGSSACTMDSITVNSGTLNFELAAALSIRGSIRVKPAGLFKLGPTSGNVSYRLNGVATQVLRDSSTSTVPLSQTASLISGIRLAPSVRLIVDNPAGVRMSESTTTLIVPGILEFAQGRLTIDDYSSLWLGSTGSIVGASPGTGWVDGYVYYNFLPGGGSRTIDVGNESTHTPIDLSFQGVTDTAYVQVSAHRNPTNPSYLPGSGLGYFQNAQLDTLQKVNIGYRIYIEGPPVYSSFAATFHFASSDIDAGADPSQFVVRGKSTNGFTPQPWRALTPGPLTSTSTGAVGITRNQATDSYFSFAIGEPTVVRVSALDGQVVEGNSPGTTVPMRIVLSEAAAAPVAVNYQTGAITAAQGADYVGMSGTLSFAPGDTVLVVQVPVFSETMVENHETFSLTLSNPYLVVLDRSVAIGTILDDDDVTPPSVTVLAPNGGETVIAGASVDLTWSATDNVIVKGVDLMLSRDDGANYEPIATGLPNTGSYSWISTGPLTQLARLKVIALDHRLQVGQDVSNAVWAIWGADAVDPVLPQAFALDLASANPSIGASRIRYALPRDSRVRLAIVDVRGRVACVLRDGAEAAGVHEATWASGAAASGIYFVCMTAGDWTAQRRLIRLR